MSCWCGSTPTATIPATPCAWCAPRSTTRRRRVSIPAWRRSPSRSRSNARATSTASASVVCPDEPTPAPVIDYLAKDYASFRRLILDRITQLVPGWRERSAADLGVTLAELVAYAGDQLSYRQDAVATEAYLETARRRTSLRRHALLVDYHLHDGCNARVWLHLTADAANVALSQSATRFYTRLAGVTPRLTPVTPEDEAALRARPVIFEPLHDAVLHRLTTN